MSLQTARQLLQELEGSIQPPTDSQTICDVLQGLLDSHEDISEQARKFNQEAQDAMNLKLSFDVIGGGEGSKWPVAFGSNVNSYKQLNHDNQQLRHMLQVVKSSRFHQEVYQHLCLDEARVFFTSNADLSATCNALLRENKQHRDSIQIAQSTLQLKGPEAQQIAYLQQELDKAHRAAQGRILEDLQIREYTERVHLHNHSLLQKINFLTDSNRQLNQSIHTLQHQQTLQAGRDAGGLTAGSGQSAHETVFSDTKAIAHTTPKPLCFPSTGNGGNGKDDPLSSTRVPAPMHRHAIPANAASQTHHGVAPPSSSRLTVPYSSNEHDTDDRAEVVAALPATHDKDPADEMSQPVAAALPLPGLDVPSSSPHNKDTQQPLPDAPAVPIAAYIPWGDTSAIDVDGEVDGWSDHDDPVDMSQANAPAASKPNTFLEAACKGGIPEEVPIPEPKASAVTTASVTRQGRSAGRGSAVLREDGRAASGVQASQNTSQAARRPQTVAENGWHTVTSKKGSKSAKHVIGDGKDVHSAAQPTVIGGRLAPARANSNTEQTDDNHDGSAERLTKSQKKRHARRRRKALQQQDS